MKKLEEQLKSEERVKEGLEKMTALYGTLPNQGGDLLKNQETIKQQLETSKNKIDALIRQIESVKGLLGGKESTSGPKKQQQGIINRRSTIKKKPISEDITASAHMKKSNTVSSFSTSSNASGTLGIGLAKKANRSFVLDKGGNNISKYQGSSLKSIYLDTVEDNLVHNAISAFKEPLERDYTKFCHVCKLISFVKSGVRLEDYCDPLELVKSQV